MDPQELTLAVFSAQGTFQLYNCNGCFLKGKNNDWGIDPDRISRKLEKEKIETVRLADGYLVFPAAVKYLNVYTGEKGLRINFHGKGYGTYCLTEPDIDTEKLENLKERLKSHPHAYIASDDNACAVFRTDLATKITPNLLNTTIFFDAYTLHINISKRIENALQRKAAHLADTGDLQKDFSEAARRSFVDGASEYLRGRANKSLARKIARQAPHLIALEDEEKTLYVPARSFDYAAFDSDLDEEKPYRLILGAQNNGYYGRTILEYTSEASRQRAYDRFIKAKKQNRLSSNPRSKM